jgi:carbon-monoxide dehydrogenase medium subunit
MYDFKFYQPRTLDEASELLEQWPNSKLIAGGMSLVPTLKFRLAKYDALIDLSGIKTLNGIKVDPDYLEIGAMAKHVEVASSFEVKSSISALSNLASGIGDPYVRNRGTLGGSISNADPAADYPAAILGLDCEVLTNRRSMMGDEFFKGFYETELNPGEFVVSVKFRKPLKSGYVKLRHPASRFAIMGIFVSQYKTQVRVAVTGAASRVFRVKDAELALGNQFHVDAIKDIRLEVDELNSDIHASAAYRSFCFNGLLKRCLDAMHS